MSDLAIVLPVFNDWHSARLLLQKIDTTIAEIGLDVSLVLVDDGSVPRLEQTWRNQKGSLDLQHLRSVEILRLRANVGHQQAIAVGLTYIANRSSAQNVLVMDADGEDRPEEIPRLIRAMRESKTETVVFGARALRTEGWTFRMMYKAYRLLFRILTGRKISVGNFALVPRSLLEQLVVMPDLPHSFAMTLLRSSLPKVFLECNRGKRIAGSSKMNLTSLMIHGLNGILLWGDVIGARALLVAALIGILSIGCALVAIAIKLGTALAIPGWATNAVGLAVLATLQSCQLLVIFVLLIFASQRRREPLPLGYFETYIAERVLMHGSSGQEPVAL